jgi:hypothetical protein
MAELKTYQERDKKVIKSEFIKRGDKWGISLASYDKTQALIIDPLVYSTYIGGIDGCGEEGSGIVVDGSGNAYVTGYTWATNYDVTVGAFQITYGGGSTDAFVTKLNASGSGLVYSTYIGGSGEDRGLGIAVDGSGNAYVTGITWSTDYDVTTGAFQTTNGGNYDVIVTKLNASGSGLVYSTYIGGSGDDWGNAIAVDGSGNAYVTGYTQSIDYDVTVGAFQTTNEEGSLGGGDVFVTKLNASGSALVYSTYIGGGLYDEGSGIAVDGSGNAYVTGSTSSTDYDVTPGAFQTTYGGGFYDVFVTKLDMSGTTALENYANVEWSLFSVYPNPSYGSFTLQTEQGGVFELIDITGRVLNTYTLTTNTAQAIQVNLPVGMYFIREQASGATQKLIIE